MWTDLRLWRVIAKLDDYLDRLEQDTAEWAKAHPLNPRATSVPRSYGYVCARFDAVGLPLCGRRSLSPAP